MNIVPIDWTDPLTLQVLWLIITIVGVSGVSLAAMWILRQRLNVSHFIGITALLGCLFLPIAAALTISNGLSISKIHWTLPVSAENFPETSDEHSAGLLSEPLEQVPQLDLTTLASQIYLVVAALMFARLASAFYATKKIVSSSRSVQNESPILERLSREYRSPFVQVLISKRARSPFVFDPVRPTLVVSDTLVRLGDEDLLRMVVAHEAAHVRLGHLWTGWIVRLATILFWPVPTVSLLGSRILALQERICDQSAAEAGGAVPYSNLLVKLSTHSPSPVSCGMGFTKSQLEARIKDLLDTKTYTTKTMKPTAKAALLGAMLTSMTLLAGTRIVVAQDAQPPVTLPEPTRIDYLQEVPPATIRDVIAPAPSGQEGVNLAAPEQKRSRKSRNADKRTSRNAVKQRQIRERARRVKGVVLDLTVPAAPTRAGMTLTETGRSHSKVTNDQPPILSRIPVIHNLFRTAPKSMASRRNSRVAPIAPAAASSMTRTDIADARAPLAPSEPQIQLAPPARLEPMAPGAITAPAPIQVSRRATTTLGRLSKVAAAPARDPIRRLGTTTVIRNATVVIHPDGTVEIKGGTTTKPQQKTFKPKQGK
ncbi:MAG: M56 family metallopeptidase [Chthonomonadaceae bacterium]|nr:M56 family metallopeptidase [Chthonomonadaceae bacterium]